MENKKLFQLDIQIKQFLFTFIITLSFGVLIGLSYLYYTTNYIPSTAIERINGSEINSSDEFNIPEQYPKPVSELLITTHNHIIAFSFIFFFTGGIFYYNSIIVGRIKQLMIIEPFISTIISFSSIWGMRYIHPGFVYVTAISSSLIYISFFMMVSIIIYELKFKKII
ncbi:MAG: hypothetical protein EHM44_00725 [Ignavibacteriales bacterium]|nr:MAG: hypothetical protein EHM44_00725 [Ignavibacteriales bacterium]